MTALSTIGFAVAIGGVPGSGKTTIGRALARRLGAALLDLDTLTNPLLARIAADSGAGDDLDHPALRGQVRSARYRCLADTARDVLDCGLPVLLVAPFTTELADPVAWQRFCAIWQRPGPARHGGPPGWLVEVVVPASVAAGRRRRRGLPRDLAAGAGRTLTAGRATPDVGVPTPNADTPNVPDAPDTAVVSNADPPAPAADFQADGTADPDAEADRIAALLRARR